MTEFEKRVEQGARAFHDLEGSWSKSSVWPTWENENPSAKEETRKIVRAILAVTEPMHAEEMAEDAARYRYLRDHCSSHYPMTSEQPAEWSIGWEFQQRTPNERFGSFDLWIDADIEHQRKIDAENDAEDATALREAGKE